MNVLTANPKSYTIEWMNASRKASLERARLRYRELKNTQIIHYQRNSRNRYALVSLLFVNRSEALTLCYPHYQECRHVSHQSQTGCLFAVPGRFNPTSYPCMGQTRDRTLH